MSHLCPGRHCLNLICKEPTEVLSTMVRERSGRTVTHLFLPLDLEQVTSSSELYFLPSHFESALTLTMHSGYKIPMKVHAFSVWNTQSVGTCLV